MLYLFIVKDMYLQSLPDESMNYVQNRIIVLKNNKLTTMPYTTK